MGRFAARGGRLCLFDAIREDDERSVGELLASGVNLRAVNDDERLLMPYEENMSQYWIGPGMGPYRFYGADWLVPLDAAFLFGRGTIADLICATLVRDTQPSAST